MNFSIEFVNQMKEILNHLKIDELENVVDKVLEVKNNKGRIFFCGSGGGAGHSSHASADFRKLLNIESYSVTDNVSELTARINDDGWETSYKEILKSSNFSKKDALFVFSVGGGSKDPAISIQLINAIDYSKQIGASVIGVAGRDGGYLKSVGDAIILIHTVNENFVTPHTEGMQAYLWHFLVSHPKLNPNTPKWESV